MFSPSRSCYVTLGALRKQQNIQVLQTVLTQDVSNAPQVIADRTTFLGGLEGKVEESLCLAIRREAELSHPSSDGGEENEGQGPESHHHNAPRRVIIQT